MKIDVIPVYGKVLSNHISSCTVIVVDVLRSTSCIITAVGNGATKVVPAIDPGGCRGRKTGRCLSENIKEEFRHVFK